MYDEKSNLHYRHNNCYAVTIAPDDTKQSFYAVHRMKNVYNHYKDVFDKIEHLYTKLTKHIDWWFRMELSEPIGHEIASKGPRAHFHGVIHLKDKVGVYIWLCDLMPLLLTDARLSVKTIPTNIAYNEWILYCYKQKDYIPHGLVLSNQADVPLYIGDFSGTAAQDGGGDGALAENL